MGVEESLVTCLESQVEKIQSKLLEEKGMECALSVGIRAVREQTARGLGPKSDI